jgi:hypothetical protein
MASARSWWTGALDAVMYGPESRPGGWTPDVLVAEAQAARHRIELADFDWRWTERQRRIAPHVLGVLDAWHHDRPAHGGVPGVLAIGEGALAKAVACRMGERVGRSLAAAVLHHLEGTLVLRWEHRAGFDAHLWLLPEYSDTATMAALIGWWPATEPEGPR